MRTTTYTTYDGYELLKLLAEEVDESPEHITNQFLNSLSYEPPVGMSGIMSVQRFVEVCIGLFDDAEYGVDWVDNSEVMSDISFDRFVIFVDW
jgi:hypothetical protein